MKKFRKFLIVIVCMVLPFLLGSCGLFGGEADPSTFDAYTEELFYLIMGDDEMTNHFLFKNPENYGLSENASISLPTPAAGGALGKIIINLYFGDIYDYDYNKLNFDQQMTYNVITNLIENINEETTAMNYMGSSYLGSYLGYQAQLPLLLGEYRFDDEQDIENYFALMDLVPETFKVYVDFEKEKTDKGYGMPDFVIDKVIDQCKTFINDVDNHFLIKTFEERLLNLPISSFSRENYADINELKVKTALREGYEYVAENLGSLKGKATNNLGLSYYKEGKEYYRILFKNETGYDVSIEDAISYIETKLLESYDNLKTFKSRIDNDLQLKEQVENVQLMQCSADEQIEQFKSVINGHFPMIVSYPRVNIEYIDASMEEHFSPAAYMVSPIDDNLNEYIYLNDSEIANDYNYLYHTLAHEGIPGHMYQNIYFKKTDANIIRKVLKSSGYTEGWATYAEMYMLELLDGDYDFLGEYLKCQSEFTGALQCRLDMGIHYEGWGTTEVFEFLSKYLMGYTMDNAQKILEQLIEVPTNSQIYFFTYFKMKDMYERASMSLGANFNEVDYHRVILDCGPVPLRFVEKVVDDYIDNKES